MDISSQIFTTTVEEALGKSIFTKTPLLIYVTDNSGKSDRLFNSLIGFNNANPPSSSDNFISTIRDQFVWVKIVKDSIDYQHFEDIFHPLTTPSIVIFQNISILANFPLTVSKSIFRDRIESIIAASETQSAKITKLPLKKVHNKQHQQQQLQQPSMETVQEHRKSVFNNARETAEFREETERIRQLIKYDQMERISKQDEFSPAGTIVRSVDSSSNKKLTYPVPKQSSELCKLQIKLFDGTTLRHDFKASDSLRDVREWLDEETNNEIITDPNEYMTSIVETATPDPTGYAFYSYRIGTVDVDNEAEASTLEQLKLTPRSVLILQPIYPETQPETKRGFLGTVFTLASKLGNAMYSFFDHEVDHAFNDEDDTYNSDEISDADSEPEVIEEFLADRKEVTVTKPEERVTRKKNDDLENEDLSKSEDSGTPGTHTSIHRDPGAIRAPSRCSTPSITSVKVLKSLEDLSKRDVGNGDL